MPITFRRTGAPQSRPFHRLQAWLIAAAVAFAVAAAHNLDGPSDTDALQASADNFTDALREARIAKRDAAREKRHPFTTTTAESQP